MDHLGATLHGECVEVWEQFALEELWFLSLQKEHWSRIAKPRVLIPLHKKFAHILFSSYLSCYFIFRLLCYISVSHKVCSFQWCQKFYMLHWEIKIGWQNGDSGWLCKSQPHVRVENQWLSPNQAVDASIIWHQVKHCWSGHFLQVTLHNTYIYGHYHYNQVDIRQLMQCNSSFVYITDVTFVIPWACVETKIMELDTIK